ncbi:MAG: UdgX family uracil-DNA binding protein [Proteobacteria bacterium]|nr:UdgX family uracil-DNA binding protein [Pseudomonadota bacterium]
MTTLVRLASELDFAGWRTAARALRLNGVAPDQVAWTVGREAELYADAEPLPQAPETAAFAAPRAFLALAEALSMHRAPERFALAYRLLWRLAGQPNLLSLITDPEVERANRMAREVERAAYRMKQYVRFRKVADEAGGEAYIAWIEPEHRALARAAPFFVDRFANMAWAILTPDQTVRWRDGALEFGPGAPREAAPKDDELEAMWRTYFASTFNPARLKVKAMTTQMPKRLWRNLPEAELIPSMIAQAARRSDAMVANPPSEPARRTARAIQRKVRDAPYDDGYRPNSTQEVWAAVDACRRCELWRNATQGVAGEGPARAALMLVGEQPGDQEDLAGKPFVGPAGQLLNRALEEAGVPRDLTYVTNAVKHFKFEPRGKRRIHAKPNAGEIRACRWWLDSERRLVKPKVIVALGATAGQAVFGHAVSVMKDRGAPESLGDGATGLLTVHPSYMLRIPDEADKARAYALFVQDLKQAWSLAA